MITRRKGISAWLMKKIIHSANELHGHLSAVKDAMYEKHLHGELTVADAKIVWRLACRYRERFDLGKAESDLQRIHRQDVDAHEVITASGESLAVMEEDCSFFLTDPDYRIFEGERMTDEVDWSRKLKKEHADWLINCLSLNIE